MMTGHIVPGSYHLADSGQIPFDIFVPIKDHGLTKFVWVGNPFFYVNLFTTFCPLCL